MSKILLVYVSKNKTPYLEAISLGMLEEMQKIINDLGHVALIAEYKPDTIISLLNKMSPDIIFNMTYGYVCKKNNINENQPDTLERMESYKNCTILGSNSKIQRLAQDKALSSQFLTSKGFNLPLQFNIDNLCNLPNNQKLLIKPRFGACHRDITLLYPSEIIIQKNINQLIIQEYIEGKEFSVGIVEINGKAMALPPLEIIFNQNETNHVLGLNKMKFSFKINTNDDFKLQSLSQQIFIMLNLRHYARIDYRIKNGTPICIDINTLPNLNKSRSFLPIIARLSGLNYKSFINILVRSATHG